ncbi:hypothetical protein M426DRAFT_320489 [Hypoxylon sp. CI-4A]|nr:hypothetical protein M426DRAFT_320489 [Hypoxylon sp. CI-4A]
MLRSTRSLLTNSSRAISSRRTPISPVSKLQLSTISRATTSSSLSSKTSTSPSLLPIQQARHVSKTPSGIQYNRDPEEEKKIGERKLESNPEVVTTESSVRHLYEPDPKSAEKPIKHGVKDDLANVKDTFDLSSVPREPYFLGLAGTLPYWATSLSTVYLSWNLNTEWPSTSNFVNNILISHDTARHLLDIIEPIQLGYGAVIISFLGAVHWGMEYAEKVPNPARTRFRYALGVLAPAVAWPTLFMPIDFALTSQFGAFVMLYFADTRATVRAWAPSWYGTYRFVLTAIVGAAIVVSLIGRMKVGDAKPRLTGLDEKLHGRHGEQDYTEKWENLENEEKEKIKKEKEAAEEQKKKEEEKQAKEKNKKESGKDKKKGKGEQKESQSDKGKDEDKDQGEKAKDQDEQGKDGDEEAKDGDKEAKDEGKEDEDKDEEGKDTDKQEKSEDTKDSKEEKGGEGKEDKK